MIVDALSRHRRYTACHPGFACAFAFLESIDAGRISEGRHPLHGDDVFALIQRYQTKDPAEAFWEAHRRHIDIQVVLRGCERIGFAPLARFRERLPYDAERELTVLEPAGPTDFVTLGPGEFAILWPEDAHMPSLRAAAREEVLKVVVKVRVDGSPLSSVTGIP